MKILAPISSIEEVGKIIKAGADEVYCGVINSELRKRYKVPFIIILHITSKCNLRCKYCFASCEKGTSIEDEQNVLN